MTNAGPARRFGATSAVLAALALLTHGCKKPVPRPGEPCREIGTGRCVDPRHALTCWGFTWHLDDCRGPDGCKSDAPKAPTVSCDQRIVANGDACHAPDALGCSADGRELYRCDIAEGKMFAAEMCRGPKGCRRDDPRGPPSCDRGKVEAGDPCLPTGAGSVCGGDGATLLKCSPWKRYVVDKRCRGARGCYQSPEFGSGYWVCDDTVGDVGETCGGVGNGGQWCSRNFKTQLTCKDGLLVREQDCAKGCVVNWGAKSYSVGCK